MVGFATPTDGPGPAPDSPVDSRSILESRAAKDASTYKTTLVPDKPFPIELDLGNLAAFDTNDVDAAGLRSSKEAYLRALSRDGTQALMNAIFALPTEVNEDGVFAQLPDPTHLLPREKPVPKPKPPTRWEKFAAEKGIQKKKSKGMVRDAKTDEMKPTWGYKSKTQESDWLIPVPGNADPFEDQYAKKMDDKAKVKKSQVAKTKRNSEETAKKLVSVPSITTPLPLHHSSPYLPPSDSANSSALAKGGKGKGPRGAGAGAGAGAVAGPEPMHRYAKKDTLKLALEVSKTSTASLGKYDKALAHDVKGPRGKTHSKRGLDGGDMAQERATARGILDKIARRGMGAAPTPIVDADKAARAFAKDPANKRAFHDDKKGKGGKGGKVAKRRKQ